MRGLSRFIDHLYKYHNTLKTGESEGRAENNIETVILTNQGFFSPLLFLSEWVWISFQREL